MDTLRTIRLYGKLGARFGRIHRLAVESTAEAVRALSALLPGFQAELMASGDRGVRYACFLGKANIGKDDLQLSGGSDDIRIAPILAGAKSGGFLQTIIGAALVIAGILTFPAFPTLGASLLSMGASMMLGGVVQMLSPQQSGSSAADKVENGASYNFNGPVNTTAQGNPVPVLYGRMIVGSAVISAGILAQEQAYVGSTLVAPDPSKAIADFMAAL
ncbi:MAG: tail assembly protein [Pseudomonadota bacterium]|nr:tail assembly protein [Pseudomonadota bacterium]